MQSLLIFAIIIFSFKVLPAFAQVPSSIPFLCSYDCQPYDAVGNPLTSFTNSSPFAGSVFTCYYQLPNIRDWALCEYSTVRKAFASVYNLIDTFSIQTNGQAEPDNATSCPTAARVTCSAPRTPKRQVIKPVPAARTSNWAKRASRIRIVPEQAVHDDE
ncbi:hypothetical protein BDQ12DRAFT_725903 [Crucibulum laeve]|uniref:Uncharacterized protein n=1 Tax=Crucibulum laeve TaxID=68775 RepID=A0A5C3LS19_9AGAR|nr:hypothetical protein BDQ12DRAFT_725903 [Crucibulum laeve]